MVAALTPATAYAANDGAAGDAGEAYDAYDAIVVTGARDQQASSATKTDTPILETPQTITVIDGEELARRNAQSVNQALGYVAGVAANQRGGTVTRYDQLVLRGYAPSMLLDGMPLVAGPYSRPQIDFNRVDHIDVVKGPASVLYGSSTPGGLVNLASKRPEATAFGRVEGQLGDYDFRRAAIDVNQPLTSDGTLLGRVVGGWQKGDGFTRDTFSERYHVSPMISFVPDDATNITLIAAYQRSPSGGGYSGVPAFGSVLPNPFAMLPHDINTGDPGYERYDHKARSIALFFRRDFNDALTFRSSARVQNVELSYRQLYVSGFATTGTGANRNTDYSVITRGGGGADEDYDTLTLDNSINARFETGGIRHNILAGIDYQRITGENFQQFNSGVTGNPLTSIPQLNLFAPVYRGILPSTDLTILSPNYVNTASSRDQVGLYFQNQMEIGQLQLIASGRKDWYAQRTQNKRNDMLTPFDQSAFTMRFGALYAFEFGLSPFASYSESFEPQTGATYLGEPFAPTTGHQYEAGFKYQPPGTHAIITLSAYDLRRQKVPVGDPAAGTNGIPSNARIQIGEVRVRGIELEMRGEIVPGFDVVGAAGYTDAIITQGTPAIAPTATNSGTPTTTGTRQLGTPKWAASTFLSYDFGKAGGATGSLGGALGGLSLGAGLRYVGGSDATTTYAVVQGVTTFQRFQTDDFILVDALIGYDLGRANSSLSGWSLALNAANLFDKRHVSACPFNNSCYFGASRTVIGSLRYSW